MKIKCLFGTFPNVGIIMGYQGSVQILIQLQNTLSAQIEQIETERIFFVGNSMGGYAAILFSALTGQGEVIIFSPQTFISPILRQKYKDGRWCKQIRATYEKSLFKRKIWDLKRLLSGLKNTSRISIFVSGDHRLDDIHATHIKDITGIQVYAFDGGGHEIVKLLRDRGELPAIMSGQYTSRPS